MIRRLVMCIMFTTLLPGRLPAEEWLGLDDEPVSSVLLEIVAEDAGELSGGLNLVLPPADSVGLLADYRISELSDGEEEFDNLSLATAIWFELSELVDIEFGHFFEGNSDELEKETLGLALGLTSGNWQLRVQIEEGELLIYTREDLTDFLATLIPDRFASDVSAYALMLGWQRGSWYWQASHWRYDYANDLTGLSRSDFAQFIVKSSALAHSSLLVSQIDSVSVGHANLDDDYSLLLSRERSAIDETSYDTLSFNWQRWSGSNLGYSVGATIREQVEDSGLSLGLQWVM